MTANIIVISSDEEGPKSAVQPSKTKRAVQASMVKQEVIDKFEVDSDIEVVAVTGVKMEQN